MSSAKSSRNQLIDKGLFAAFALAGAAAIIVLKSLGVSQITVTLVPVFLMIVYALLTVSRWTRFRLRYDQSGDNCYYLGFIYTLVSLGLALHGFASTALFRIDNILKDFGIALATTLTGVTLRVLLHQMREDPHDVEQAAREELGNAAFRVTGQLGSMIRDVISLRATTQNELKHFVYELKQVAIEYSSIVRKFRDQTQQLAGQVEKLAARIEAVEVPADMIERRLAPAATNLEKLTALLVSAQKDMGSTLKSVRDAATEIARSAEILKDMASVPERTVTALEKLSSVAVAVSQLQERAVDVSHQLADAASKLERLRALDSVIDRIEQLEAQQVRPKIFRWFGAPAADQ